ncbi:hypothetical protein M409DRAFT_29370 [Zasmidium cellare ATCC 36951]|uniref:Uncharacterized protein n=1 Tax=Zasmidium cellare ATCC 36951 TaxID=1080233 RepID=A0A6A6BZS8_ZASCE|nr:uncharacterized protein M409DRAFT_29370 [Zasmidium cellare ATCC 36951]KAF2160281.1 hypothetical protein M409DRAFT_29370 [Zasmidium cellare ATCC 36951]
MPPRRRANPSAAKLPASRLPLGTHLPGDDRPTSRNTDRSASSPRATSDTDTATHIDIKNHPAYKPVDTPVDTPSDMSSSDLSEASQPAHSMAEAKLRRQQERIQNAEAALTAPLHLDRREPSRGKNKQGWKPLDIEWDTVNRAKNEGGIPVQTRTNTIYGPAFSRETSLSRSLSSISQQTTTTDPERHDSLVDNAGFQTYHGRRGRKHADDLGATEDTKPEERQATVEGSFDKREMYKVFGLELPNIDFISSNCGFKDGQLQFVQHPNGDVSAHMWSHHRYMWENIGNFSNIRKRIEGQLASDRLKGETGWQTLQRNTLAYFRVIAKQREQTTQGNDFGQVEIQQILEQPPDSMKPPEASRPASPTTSTTSRQTLVPKPPLFNPGQPQATTTNKATIPSAQAPPKAPATAGVGRGFPFLSDDRVTAKEDPFNGSGIFLQATKPAVPTAKAVPTPQPPKSITTGSSSSNPFLPSDSATTSTASSRAPTVRPSRDVPPACSVLPGLPQLNVAKLGVINIGHQVEHRQASVSSAGTPTRKPTPLSSREAMRDQLWKVSEFAQQRTNSQANIRTVLHDPFQAQSVQSDDTRAEPFPDFDGRSESESTQCYIPRRYTKPSLPTYRTWRDTQPALNGTKPIPLIRPEENLADSVPDTDARSSRVTSFESSGATFVIDEPAASTPPASKKSYDEELKDWWTSGNKFARQEDLYQRIKAHEVGKASARVSRYTTTTPSTRPRPIGAPGSSRYSSSTTASPQKTDAPFNRTITRVLIPVYENLASYVQGPIEQRRDYWSNWSKPPEWCIDRSPNGNNSFFDDGWGQPPARVGRDPRYRALPGELRFGGFSPGSMGGSPRGNVLSGIPGMRAGMGFGGGGVGRY